MQHKLRRARLPALANFLCTADVVPALDDSSEPPASDPAALPRRAHPPPLFYLPAVLTPAQSAFLARKKAAVRTLYFCIGTFTLMSLTRR